MYELLRSFGYENKEVTIKIFSYKWEYKESQDFGGITAYSNKSHEIYIEELSRKYDQHCFGTDQLMSEIDQMKNESEKFVTTAKFYLSCYAEIQKEIFGYNSKAVNSALENLNNIDASESISPNQYDSDHIIEEYMYSDELYYDVSQISMVFGEVFQLLLGIGSLYFLGGMNENMPNI
ncbi:MAG: hypothetical protein EOP34_08140 [Rickettsiales bacterium]|nr:MAG: hypothetical protein EOP34_08140 [Rickettsiales bacterium]